MKFSVKNIYLWLEEKWDYAPSWIKVIIYRYVAGVVTWFTAKGVLYMVAKFGIKYDITPYMNADFLFAVLTIDTFVNVMLKVVDFFREMSTRLQALRVQRTSELMDRD